jgi:hypothetical protein
MERAVKWVRRNPVVAALTAAVGLALLAGTAVSAAFAIEANNRAESEAAAKEDALRNAGLADEQKTAAEKANKELAQSADQLLTSVARSLVRPLALNLQPNQPPPPLTDPEVEALTELGETREEKLRLRFLEEALATPTRTRQLRLRAPFALQAAVGLDPRRRAAAQRLLLASFRKTESADQQVDLALCLAALGAVDSQSARQPAKVLVASISKTTDFHELARLAQGLVAVTARMEPGEDAALWKTAALELAQALRRAPVDYAALPSLAQNLALVTARMEPDEAARILTQGVEQKWPDSDWTTQTLFAPALAEVSARLEPRQAVATLLRAPLKGTDWSKQNLAAAAARLVPGEAPGVARTLIQAMREINEPDEPRYWGTVDQLTEAFVAVAARTEPGEAAAIYKEAASAFPQREIRAGQPQYPHVWARGLAAVAARMGPRDAAMTLTDAVCSPTTHLSARASLVQSLAAEAPRLDAGAAREAATELLRAMRGTPDTLPLLARGLLASAGRLDQTEAAPLYTETATILSRVLSEPRDRRLWGGSAHELAALALRLEPGEAGWVLTEAMRQAKDSFTLEPLAQGLAAVAARHKSKETASRCKEAAAVLSRAITKAPSTPANKRNWVEILPLARGLGAVAAHLGPGEATALCKEAATIVVDGMIDPNQNLDEFAPVFAALAARLDATEASALCKKAASIIINQRVPSPGNLIAVAAGLDPPDAAKFYLLAAQRLIGLMSDGSVHPQVLEPLTARMEPKVAADVYHGAALTFHWRMREATTGYSLNRLVVSLAGVAAHLEGKQAREAAAALVQAMNDRRVIEESALQPLGRGLAGAAARLEPHEAAAILTKAMNEATNPGARQQIGQCLAEVAGRLPPREAAGLLLEALAKGPDSRALQPLGRGLADVAGRLQPREAAEVLTDAMSKVTDDATLHELARGLAAAAARLEPRGAWEAARTITQLTGRTRAFDAASNPLGEDLLAVLSQEPTDYKQARLQAVVAVLGPPPALCLVVPGVAQPALAAAPEPLPVEMIVDVLKEPLCVGPMRRAALDVLARHYRRPFTDLWDFVDYVDGQKLKLDFASPPHRGRTRAPAG